MYGNQQKYKKKLKIDNDFRIVLKVVLAGFLLTYVLPSNWWDTLLLASMG